MKIKIYSVVISAFLLISFSSFAEADVKSDKRVVANKKAAKVSTGKRSAEYFSVKSSNYNKNGLVKRKGSKKSCPAFEL